MNLPLEGGGDSSAKYMPNPLVSKRSLNRVSRCCFSRLLFDGVWRKAIIRSEEGFIGIFEGKFIFQTGKYVEKWINKFKYFK